MGFWGVILILVVAAIVLRLLRSLFEWVDYVAIAIYIVVPIVVWITNGFWAAVLAFFITSIVSISEDSSNSSLLEIVSNSSSEIFFL